MAHLQPHLVLLVKVVEVEVLLRLVLLVMLYLVVLAVVLVDQVLPMPLEQTQATQQVREVHTAIQVEQKVVPVVLDTTAEAVVVPVLLVLLVVQDHRMEKVVVELDVMLLTYLMLVMVELELLGLDGPLPMVDQQDLVLVVVHPLITLQLLVLVGKVAVVLVRGEVMQTIQAHHSLVKDFLVETTGVLVAVVVRDWVLVEVMVVMELLLLHMMQHQQLSAQQELPQLKK
jgi:hypothetical protein